MCSVTMQYHYRLVVCCYAINGNTYMESFIKAFIWKREQEIMRIELYSDKSVSQFTM